MRVARRYAWPYDQNALSEIVLRFYRTRVTMLRPGCPLNSPFAAYVRHYVGGTPDHAVYAAAHRAGWMLDALRCTVSLVRAAAAAAASDAAIPPAAAGLSGAAGAALRRPAGCAPNEPWLAINVSGLCGDGGGAGVTPLAAAPAVYRGVTPVGDVPLARVSAPWWRACCALCAAHAPCAVWAYDEEWPADARNCVLFGRIDAAARANDQRVVGRVARRNGARGGAAAVLSRTAAAAAAADGHPDVVIEYAVPEVAPWDVDF